jgi:hypothetical protein
VEWYASLRELVDGLMKNAFAGLGYSVPAVVGSCMALVLLNVWPFAALLVTGGVTWWLNAATVVCAATLFVVHARIYGSSGWQVVGYPAAVLLFCWILVRSAWLALSRGAIEWRGRRYPLDALRRARLR